MKVLKNLENTMNAEGAEKITSNKDAYEPIKDLAETLGGLFAGSEAFNKYSGDVKNLAASGTIEGEPEPAAKKDDLETILEGPNTIAEYIDDVYDKAKKGEASED
mmetsp:Transcript_15296/g.12997  ORF Transcript_15296/g.12997 Transcript_15296/m.12997 type:complete len:105 (+) Transcript_15296:3804-4118(+)